MSRYRVYVTSAASRELRALPGFVRQRARRAIDDLQTNAHPPGAKVLERIDQPSPGAGPYELCRLRIDKWRIIYGVAEVEEVIDVLAVRKRPPYDYGDLRELLGS